MKKIARACASNGTSTHFLPAPPMRRGSGPKQIMVYIFFGKERHSSGSLFIPNSPYFLALYLCETEATNTPSRGATITPVDASSASNARNWMRPLRLTSRLPTRSGEFSAKSPRTLAASLSPSTRLTRKAPASPNPSSERSNSPIEPARLWRTCRREIAIDRIDPKQSHISILTALVADAQPPRIARIGLLSCGIGFWGGQCLSLADYVRGAGGPSGRRSPRAHVLMLTILHAG